MGPVMRTRVGPVVWTHGCGVGGEFGFLLASASMRRSWHRLTAAEAEVSSGSWWHLLPAQIHGSNGGGKFGLSMRAGVISSSCINEVGLKQTHGSGRVEFGGSVVPSNIGGICIGKIQRGLIVAGG
eukprot:g31929.t1